MSIHLSKCHIVGNYMSGLNILPYSGKLLYTTDLLEYLAVTMKKQIHNVSMLTEEGCPKLVYIQLTQMFNFYV